MTPRNKPNNKSGAGTLAAKRKTPLPKTLNTDSAPTMQAIANEVAKNFQGELLRYRVINDVLIILFVDGRKHYVNVPKE